ncbi:MAG TPA: SCO family protein [Acidobacteriota bacterium]|nr:SCO family protein [Acidobacteriota bacterium]
MPKRTSILVLALLVAVAVSSCQRTPERRFELKGKVVSVDKSQHQVTLEHEAIKGYMDAMTMSFDVKDDQVLPLAPGQMIRATLVVQEDRSWIEGITITKTESEAEPIGDSAELHPAPKPGTEVPDFSLLNQDNKHIHLSQYKGQYLLLTFIYSRCPLPDYCPRTSSNFAAIHNSLHSMPSSGPKTHLLTVSFDTENDTPSVLREYAARYMRPAAFDEWEFATGTPDEIKNITGFFGVSFWRESGMIAHFLMTALIGPDGKIASIHPGNKWTPREILAELKLP